MYAWLSFIKNFASLALNWICLTAWFGAEGQLSASSLSISQGIWSDLQLSSPSPSMRGQQRLLAPMPSFIPRDVQMLWWFSPCSEGKVCWGHALQWHNKWAQRMPMARVGPIAPSSHPLPAGLWRWVSESWTDYWSFKDLWCFLIREVCVTSSSTINGSTVILKAIYSFKMQSDKVIVSILGC